MDKSYFISTNDSIGSICQTLADQQGRELILTEANKLANVQARDMILLLDQKQLE